MICVFVTVEQERANTVRTSKGLPVWSAFAIGKYIIGYFIDLLSRGRYAYVP